jgi:hypothetical protein
MRSLRSGLVVGVVSVSVAACVAACSGTTPAAPDAGAPVPTTTTTTTTTATGTVPVPVTDSGPASDANAPDTSPPLTGPFGDILGTLTGSCGQIRAEIGKPTPSVFANTLTFVTGETFDKAFLSDGGDRIFDTPNAGGSSFESEVMSFEILHYCEGATLLKTEKEITYGPVADGGPTTITDLLIEIDGKKVGVNPIRVYKPSNQPQPTEADIKTSLEGKLNSIRGSTARVTPADKWVKQVMHVYTVSQANADAVMRVLPTIDPAVRADTVVMVTRSVGGGFLYCKTTGAPVGQECP